MAEPVTDWLTRLIMALVAAFLGLFWGMQAAPPAPTAQVAPAYSLRLDFAPDPAAGTAPDAAQLDTARAVVSERLAALVENGSLAAAEAQLNDSGGIAVLLAVGTAPVEELIPALIAPGRFALLDVSALAQDDPALMTGAVIAASYSALLTNSDVVRADVLPDAVGGLMIQVEITPEAAARLESFTGEHIGSPLAITLDGVVLSAPMIQAQIGSVFVIAGDFSQTEAEALAAAIGAAALEVPLFYASIAVITEP